MAFELSSPAFGPGGDIPRKYTLDGDNLSPPLMWHGAPKGTKSFALIVEDPDAPAGTFRHWAMFNIDPGEDHLDEGAGRARDGHAMARNDFGHAQYDGPQPPKGHGLHHYHFKLLALDVPSLNAGSSIKQVASEARHHMLDEAELVGTYER